MFHSVRLSVAIVMMTLALIENAVAQAASDAAPPAQIINQCVQRKWQPPRDSNNAKLPPIKLRLRFKPDGTLATAPVVGDRMRPSRDSQHSRLYLATSYSAVMALQKCMPFRVPIAQQPLWKDVVLSFDPRALAASSTSNAGTGTPDGQSEHGTRPSGITRSTENDEFGQAVIRAVRSTMPQINKIGILIVKIILSDNGVLQENQPVIASGDPALDRAVISATSRTRFPKPFVGSTIVDRTFFVSYIYH